MSKGCGTCTLCCTLMRVEMAPRPEPPKPEGKPCQHLCRKGCGIYEDRPQSCRDFECLWLLSQSREQFGEAMPKNLRPDKTGVVLEPNNAGNIVAHCKGRDDWKRGPMGRFLRSIASRGIAVIIDRDIHEGDKTKALLLETTGQVTPLRYIGTDSASNERKYIRDFAA